MRNRTIASLAAFATLAAAFAASAQNASPVGQWETFDEDTGKPRLIVEVYEAKGGTLAAKVVDTLYEANAVCTECTGAAKGKPVKGMVIMWGQKPKGDGSYVDGSVLKLANGKTYKSKATLAAGGNTFDVYGCLGPICKKQSWKRKR